MINVPREYDQLGRAFVEASRTKASVKIEAAAWNDLASRVQGA